jgi:hypothetical protein
MEKLHNPEWWDKWAEDNYRKKSRLFRKAKTEKNIMRKVVNICTLQYP